MDEKSIFRLVTSLNNLLLSHLSLAEIGMGFDEIAEQLRNENIKIRVFEKYSRQFDLELYFALERKNNASLINDTIEVNRLKIRIRELITEKKIQEDKNLNMANGHFHYPEGIIQGRLCRLVKNEGILLHLLHAYDLRV